MPLLPLSKGLYALVDDVDYANVSQYKWTALVRDNGQRYAYRKQGGKTVYLHRELCNPEDGSVVDHINHDGLDNRRSNLRVVSQRQNMFNARCKRNSVSGYKGVSWSNRRQMWRVTIVSAEGVRLNGGFYRSAVSAADAYSRLAAIHHGEYGVVQPTGAKNGNNQRVPTV